MRWVVKGLYRREAGVLSECPLYKPIVLILLPACSLPASLLSVEAFMIWTNRKLSNTSSCDSIGLVWWMVVPCTLPAFHCTCYSTKSGHLHCLSTIADFFFYFNNILLQKGLDSRLEAY